MKLSWDKATNAAGYKIIYTHDQGTVKKDVGNVTDFEIPNEALAPGKKHIFSVVGYNCSGESKPSKTVQL